MQQSFKKRKSAQLISQLIGGMMEPATRARGFASVEVITNWSHFIGAQLAPHTKALQLKWPPRPKGINGSQGIEGANIKEGATLIVAVSGGFALELQHMMPQIIQRINTALGWKCVTKLALRQQPITRVISPVKREAPLLAAEIQRLEAATHKIDDENLRQAFTKLGKGVFERNRKK